MNWLNLRWTRLTSHNQLTLSRDYYYFSIIGWSNDSQLDLPFIANFLTSVIEARNIYIYIEQKTFASFERRNFFLKEKKKKKRSTIISVWATILELLIINKMNTMDYIIYTNITKCCISNCIYIYNLNIIRFLFFSFLRDEWM